MENEKTIDVLNNLIEINHDRIEGYKTAMEETKDDEELKASFGRFQETSFKCNAELVKEVVRLGGTPEEGTKNTGKIHRAWMDFKALISGRDKKAVLSSCAFGDEMAIETYEDTLEDELENLSPEQQSMLESQLALISADHSNVSMLIEDEKVES